MTQTLEFLELLFGTAEEGWLTLTTAPGFATEFYPVDDLDRIAKRAAALAQSSDVYFGVATRKEKLDRGRGTEADCLAVPGMWIDLDVEEGVHETPHPLPYTVDEAVALAEAFPLKPTILVSTGGGVHGYWAFDEMVDAADVEPLLDRWHETWVDHADGVHIDNVSDLPRILRVPGTINHKGGKETPVTVIWADGPRYGLSEMEEALLPAPVKVAPPPAPKTVIDPSASPIDSFNASHGRDWMIGELETIGFKPANRYRVHSDGHVEMDFEGSVTRGNSTSVYEDHAYTWSETAKGVHPWLAGVNNSVDPFTVLVNIRFDGDMRKAMAWCLDNGFGVRVDVDAAIEEWLPETVDDEDDENSAGGWYISDLASFLAGDYNPPTPSVLIRNDDAGVFYAGRVNMLFGESGSGKSWLALQAAKEEMENGGTVLYLDWEDTLAGVAGRLLSMGVDRDLMLDRFIHVKPQAAKSAQSMAMVKRLIDERHVSLVVVDSTGEAMALDGAKPNDDDDTARWFKALPQWIADQGVTVILIDHVPKANEGGGPRLQSIGSQRKRAAVTGLSLSLEVLTSPAKGQSGKLKGTCAKDRHGTYAQKEVVAIIDLLSLDEGDSVQIVVRKPDDRDVSETAKRVAQDVFLFIKSSDSPSKNAIEKGVKGKAAGIRSAIDMLVKRGNIAADPTSGRFSVVKDFDLELDWMPELTDGDDT